MKAFQHSFDLDSKSSSYANLSGNIVSVLQGGCFFGAAASFWLSDKMLVPPPPPAQKEPWEEKNRKQVNPAASGVSVFPALQRTFDCNWNMN